jgi:hypothetical protein
LLAPATILGGKPRWLHAVERRPLLWLGAAGVVLLLLGIAIGQIGDPEKPTSFAPGASGVAAHEAEHRDEPREDEPAAIAPVDPGIDPPWPADDEIESSGRWNRGRGKGKGRGKHKDRDKTRERWDKARDAYEGGDMRRAVHEVARILEDDPGHEPALRWMQWAQEQGFVWIDGDGDGD